MTVLAGTFDAALADRVVDGPGGFSGVEGDAAWADEVRRLLKLRGATLLAHNYQLPEIQDVADHVCDSLALSRIAAEVPEDTIVFAGVHFMAETAKILSPEKTVLIPDQRAGCSLADSITADELRAWKAEHPGAVVVSYVNTTAAVKAEMMCLWWIEPILLPATPMVPGASLAAETSSPNVLYWLSDLTAMA